MEEQKGPQNQQVLETPVGENIQIKKSISVLTIVLILLLVLSLGSTVYFAYQNMQLTKQIGEMKNTMSLAPGVVVDTIAGWQTYSDPDGVYRFKYPAGWYLQEKSKGNPCISQSDPSLPVLSNGLCVFRYPNENNLDIKSWYKQSQNVSVSQLNNLVDTTFISQPAIQTVPVTMGGITNNNIFVMKNNSVYDLVETIKDKMIIDQILSTFKFTQ